VLVIFVAYCYIPPFRKASDAFWCQGLVLVASFGPFFGCHGGPQPEAPRPGVLISEIGDDIRILDPGLSTDSVTFRVLTNIYEGLTRVGPGGLIVPGIASKIEVSKDKRSYTFF